MQALSVLLIAFLALLNLSLTSAFNTRLSRISGLGLTSRVALKSPSALSVFGGKKKEEAKPAAPVDSSEYWQGDWVCADCGYVYDKDIDGNGKYFEEQSRGFICPQCSAPRKRYAKKVGDKWGVTNDGGDLPIYAFTIIGLGIVTWFTLSYVPNL